MNALATHRKCQVCGSISTDLSQEKCKCGAYMYMISQCYSPKVAMTGTDKKKRNVNKTESV